MGGNHGNNKIPKKVKTKLISAVEALHLINEREEGLQDENFETIKSRIFLYAKRGDREITHDSPVMLRAHQVSELTNLGYTVEFKDDLKDEFYYTFVRYRYKYIIKW